MRCPKCSFISFDVVETCVKCGKNISSAAQELHGTVASSGAPAFLQMQQFAEPEPETAVEGAEAEMEFDLGGGEEAVFDLGAEEGPSQEAGALDLGIAEPAAEVAAEPVMDLGGLTLEETTAAEPVFAETAAPEAEAPAFDIADLAPPQEEPVPEEAVAAGDLEFAEVAAAKPQSARTAGGLADLKVEGIDLEAAPAGGTGKVMPSVKTGTALDDFDIDLGDLLPKKK